MFSNGRTVGAVVTLNGWYIDLLGAVHQFTKQHTVLVANTVESDFISLGEGFLIGFTVRELSNSTFSGQLYVSVFAANTTSATGPLASSLAGGFVYRGSVLGWPVDRSESCATLAVGKSWVQPTIPGAGLDWNLPISGFGCHLVDVIGFALTTSAAVAVRTVVLQFQPFTTLIMPIPASATQIASLTRNYWFLRAATLPANTATDTFTQLPVFGLGISDALLTVTTNLQAADQFGAILIGGDWYQDMS